MFLFAWTSYQSCYLDLFFDPFGLPLFLVAALSPLRFKVLAFIGVVLASVGFNAKAQNP